MMVDNLPFSFIVSFTFLFGAAIGSFLNVCIYRLPDHESIVLPASHCRSCSQVLSWYENVPLLSYLLQRGKCRSCGARFSSRYFWVELLTAFFAIALVYRFGLTVTTIGYFIFLAALVAITFIDLDHQIIPDVISLPGVVVGIVFSLVSPALTLGESVIGAVAGAGVLLAVFWGYYLVTHEEGLGMGDPKLLAMIGAFLGWRAIGFTLFCASLAGSLVGVTLMLRRGAGRKMAIPFGPFLAFGAVCYLFFGEQLIKWYLDLF
ncbi:MAG TPA: A24 family peptidase [Methylomirabilota bacterium]|jgi:leader peptidase (prepilin peptidase)/N-methyltransferase|nr:A24 family peptidase [Methylomirabilota bacterium]